MWEGLLDKLYVPSPWQITCQLHKYGMVVKYAKPGDVNAFYTVVLTITSISSLEVNASDVHLLSRS